jgi:hypothetical protein
MAVNAPAEILESWRELYKCALAETDAQKLPLRIAHARRALILRSRQLFSTSPNYTDEAEAIDNALYALGRPRKLLEVENKGS